VINRRKHKRYIRRCEIEFVSDGVTYRGIASDFSLNGLFIRTNHPLPGHGTGCHSAFPWWFDLSIDHKGHKGLENSYGKSDRKSDQNFQERDGSRDYKKGYQFPSFYQVNT